MYLQSRFGRPQGKGTFGTDHPPYKRTCFLLEGSMTSGVHSSTPCLAGVFYIEVYGDNACFLTLCSELYYTSKLNHNRSAYQCRDTDAQRDPIQLMFEREERPELTFKVRIMKDNNRALHEESLE